MKCWILCTLVFVVTLQLTTCSSTLNAQIEDCTKYCLKTKKGSSSQCQLYCEGGFTSPQKTLEIFVDGVPITESMSDSLAQLSLSRVRFDRALFNTPSAFDELVQWTDVLKQQVATAAERVFHPGDGQQFHLLPMPIPLSNEQLNSADFMNRIVDVVPVSNLVYKESSPLMFSEAYKQFLLDVKVDQSNFNTPQSPEVLERIKHLEQVIQNDMNAFLAAGDRCYSGYENHLAAHNLKRISYTFDSYAPSNGDCLQADQYMAAHEAHSRELADYLASINPYDELFRSIASTTSMKQDWETNVDRIRQFANEQIHLENSGQSPSAFHIALDMIRYYLKQEYFGSSVQLEESCLNAHVQFYAKGWTQIPVSPKQWYSQAAIDKYRHMGTNSGTNYFGNGGYLQRQVTQLVVAYKPVLKFTVGKAMKDTFIEQSTMRNFRVLEVGPFVYDRVDFNSNTGTGLVDSYEMVISANNQDAQLIGYKTRSFDPIDVPRVDTSGWAFCRREAACQMNRIPLVAIHRYSRPGRHFLTTNFNELGGGAHGWAYEGVAGHCHGHQHPGTVPIYRYSHRSSAHLYTTNWNELGGGIHGWNYEGVMCYVYPHQAADTIPLHRYSHVRGDRLFTTNWGELGGGGHGWNYEGVACYVHHQSALDQAIGCCKCS